MRIYVFENPSVQPVRCGFVKVKMIRCGVIQRKPLKTASQRTRTQVKYLVLEIAVTSCDIRTVRFGACFIFEIRTVQGGTDFSLLRILRYSAIRFGFVTRQNHTVLCGLVKRPHRTGPHR